MYDRNFFTNKIEPFVNKPVVKVLTGMRRVGKSSILKLLKSKFNQQSNVIIHINKESLRWNFLKNENDLYDYVLAEYQKKKRKLYLLVDEIQEIKNWERAINSFLSEEIADIYITGSNAHLLSSELATLLAGRYVEFPIYGLSLKEYKTFRQVDKISEVIFLEYLQYGSLPGIHHGYIEDEIVFEYLSSIFDTILLRDIISRNNIRNIDLLEKIILFIMDNVGNIFSAKKVSDFLKKEQRKVGTETIYNYVRYLENAFIVYKVPRYDIKGKKLLEIHEKYFLGDIGLRNAKMGYNQQNINAFLENIIFLELKRRDYKVSIGKIGSLEIDFIGEKRGEKIYIQVCYLLASETVMEREFGSLKLVKDNYPKYVVSMDTLWNGNIEGIIHYNIRDFLLKDDW